MKARLNRQELAEALAAAGSVAPTRTPKPILQGVLIDAQADCCLLAATDLETGIRITVSQVEVDKKGQIVVPVDKLGQIVRESQDDVLEIELDDTVCHVRGEGAHFQIYSHDPADFPPVAELDGEPDFGVEAGLLRKMAEWTVFAAARENTRYAINGVLWEKQKDKLTLVATDGRRLACARGAVQGGADRNMESIVPVKGMSLFQRVIHDGDSAVGVKLGGNQLVVKTSRATISTGLVEGQFPNYHDVIPKDAKQHVKLKTDALYSAVKRAALLTNEESKGVRLSFTEDTLTLSSRAPSQGEATITVPIDFKGTPLDIGFNPHFLLEALRVVAEDEVTFDLKEPNKPGLLKTSPDFLYVVMPVSLS